MKNPRGNWHEFEPIPSPIGGFAARRWVHRVMKVMVLRSATSMVNGDQFIHVSLSGPDRIPTWEEVSKVKEDFLGSESTCYHCIPARKDYVNLHKFCLHIWMPLGAVKEIANLKNIVNETAI